MSAPGRAAGIGAYARLRAVPELCALVLARGSHSCIRCRRPLAETPEASRDEREAVRDAAANPESRETA